MSVHHNVIVRPVVSEKSYGLHDQGVYTFVVDNDANKVEIRKAIEALFSVSVTKVNTLNRRGKTVRGRRGAAVKKSNTKHAVVTLKHGDRIELFEGA